jgi:hypothetical protein
MIPASGWNAGKESKPAATPQYLPLQVSNEIDPWFPQSI